jgi:uncharacterized membrane protein YczE
MEDLRLTIGYLIWALVIGLTLGFFSFFSKKNNKLGSLIFLVLLPVWIIAAIALGIEHMYIDDSMELFSIRGFVMLLAESLPLLILFGGITFTIKYLKFKKNKNSVP